jgi:hypothetical protein
MFAGAHQLAGVRKVEMVGGAEMNHRDCSVFGEFIDGRVSASQAEFFATGRSTFGRATERAAYFDSEAAQPVDVRFADKANSRDYCYLFHIVDFSV